MPSCANSLVEEDEPESRSGLLFLHKPGGFQEPVNLLQGVKVHGGFSLPQLLNKVDNSNPKPQRTLDDSFVPWDDESDETVG